MDGRVGGIAKRAAVAQLPAMPAKHSPAFRIAVALGLGLTFTACGPIAFQDTVNFKSPEPKPEPEPAPEMGHARLEGDHIIIDDKIQFEHNSSEIKPVSFEILDDVVKVMQDNPQVEQLDVIGHTSSEGSAKLNKKLSTDRAAAVKDYLISHGVDASRMISEGKGPSEPIADNDTEEGRVANRRVEFKVTKMGSAEGGAAAKGGARARPGS
jgi:outer membrane protein OmpA-like peptidoglycan-associated protein